MKPIFLWIVAMAWVPFLTSGCELDASARNGNGLEKAGTVVDAAFVQQPTWDDGQAEVAFYNVHRTSSYEGRDTTTHFVAGAYVVKQRFDVDGMTKATGVREEDGVPAFKSGFFYEFEHGSYQIKRSYVVNARRSDLRPLKQSFTSFDWCSNQYRELRFPAGGDVQYLMRSDDYGNSAWSFSYEQDAYPVASLPPLLVRSLDFSQQQQRTFEVVLDDGTFVGVKARLDGDDTVDVPAGTFDAQRIVLAYDDAVPSMVDAAGSERETYWRGTGDTRLLLMMEASNGRYGMALVEQVRAPYWRENVWKQLQKVTTRP